jgi:hypothetical protein
MGCDVEIDRPSQRHVHRTFLPHAAQSMRFIFVMQKSVDELTIPAKNAD